MAEGAEAEIFKEQIHLEMGWGIFDQRDQVLKGFYNNLNYLKSRSF